MLINSNFQAPAFKGRITVIKQKSNGERSQHKYSTGLKQDAVLKPFLAKCLLEESDQWDIRPSTAVKLDNKIYDATKCIVGINKSRQVFLREHKKHGSCDKNDIVYTYSDKGSDDKDGTTVVIEDLV